MNNLETLLFNIKLPSCTPTPGSLLIAEPFLRESYFNHAVVYLVDYAKGENSMGLVMNKMTNYQLTDIVTGIMRNETIPIFCGGPLSCDHLYYVHTLGQVFKGAREISPGIFVGGDFNHVIEYINHGYPIDGNLRFCLGYSGWGSDQLDNELHDHVWAVAPACSATDLLTGSDDNYWHEKVKALGLNYRGWLYHPQNPQMN